ncbi:MAG: cytochrome c biogenesis protein CcsA [Deltaproteobacteria bacterium]|nr:cytochrome c biogenesis protein CcsA [Deltaproteobacteria bacterium]
MEHPSYDAGIPAFGTGVLYAFLVTAAISLCLAVLAGTDRGPSAARFLRAARMSALGTCALIGLDVMLLLYGFLSHDFRIRYVAHYSDRSMPLHYLITALWGGQDGSLLWWTFLLSIYTSICVFTLRTRYKELAPWVIATLMGVVVFFGVIMSWAANPFSASFVGAPLEGEGLNPSLQNFYMAIHPPSLYVGFVGCAVPFAFAVAALITGRLGEEWTLAARRWVLFAWMFLSIGNVLGMLWAYEELGWGGFWAWDPVENAACLPWWTITAYLHSVMIQERRGILKVWNVALLLFSFFLTIFGTFLTRSGLISSVHSFAQSGIGIYFVWFMGFLAVLCIGLVVWRLPLLRKAAEIDALLSREAMFVANNWMLLGICVFIALATTWPKIAEWLWGERLTVGATFYNAWLAPVAVLLLLMMAIGVLTPWRKGSPDLLLKAFRGPLVAGLAAGTAHAVFGRAMGFPAVVNIPPIYDVVTPIKLFGATLGSVNVGRSIAWLDGHLPAVATGLVALNIAALAQEYWRGTRARMASKGESAPVALTRLVGKNRRRYGGYLSHLGFVLMMAGWVGAAYRQEAEAVLSPGESFRLGQYTMRYEGIDNLRDIHVRQTRAIINVTRNGSFFATMHPARFVYTSRPEQPTSEVAIAPRLSEDLYLTMNSVDPTTRVAHLKAFVNPLTLWIWIGAMVLVAGVILAMWPEASKAAARATRAKGGRPVPLAGQSTLLLVAGLAGGAALLLTSPASAQNNHQTSADSNARQASPEERRVFEQLRCMCGDCPRESLSTCTCGFADGQRQRIRERLARGDSASTIIEQYVERYGSESLEVPPDRGANKGLYLVPVAVMIAGGAMGLRLVRRWARKPVPVTPAPAKAPAAEKVDSGEYDARINEELRGHDD